MRPQTASEEGPVSMLMSPWQRVCMVWWCRTGPCLEESVLLFWMQADLWWRSSTAWELDMKAH